MQNSEIRKALGSRVKQLRKQKNWSQKQLSSCIDDSYQQLNKHESGIHAAPLDKLIQLADALNTSIDYLITGNVSDDIPLFNKRLLQRFKLLENFDSNKQETVIDVIDAMVAKQQIEATLEAFKH